MKIVLAVFLLGSVTCNPLPYEPIDGLLPLVAQIKGILSTEYGYNQLREYFLSLDATDPVVQEVHEFIHSSSKEYLRNAIRAFFANIPIIAIEPGFNYPTLKTLFGEVKSMILTDDGIVVLRNYLENLHSTQPLLKQVLGEIHELTNEELKHVATVLFSKVQEVYMVYANNADVDELVKVLSKVKLNVISGNGLQVVRDHMTNLQTTNPNLILAKTVLSSMSDRSLLDLVKDVAKDIPDLPAGTPTGSLIDLVKQGKDLINSDNGIAFIKNYFDNLKTSNFLIMQLKVRVAKAEVEEMKVNMENGFKEVFGYASWGYSSSYAVVDELKQVLSVVKHHILKLDGIQMVRDHLNNLATTNPNLILARTVLSSMSDKSLKDLVNDVAKGVDDYKPVEGGIIPPLIDLVRKSRNLIITSEGTKYIRDYFEKLQTTNYLIMQLKLRLQQTTDEIFKEHVQKGFDEVFGTNYAAPGQDIVFKLQNAFVMIKHTLKSESGFQELKKYFTDLHPDTLTVAIGKAYFLTLTEAQMRELKNEFLKNFGDIEIEPGFDYPNLGQLFGQVRELILTSEGLQALRDYGERLQTTDPTILRIKAALMEVDDDTLTGVLTDLLKGV